MSNLVTDREPRDKGEKPPRTSGNLLRLPAFFMNFRGPKAHPNRQACQRISGKVSQKSMAVLSVPGAAAETATELLWKPRVWTRQCVNPVIE